MSLINKEDEAVTNFRKYLQIPTVHPNVDYSEFYLKFKKFVLLGILGIINIDD